MARPHTINDEITGDQIRLIGEEGEQLGILALAKALELAGEQDLDLVEISPNADPKVCRLMDYGKFLYANSKKKQEAKKKQKQITEIDTTINKNTSRRLKNEALRPPKAAREASWAAKGPLGALRGAFGSFPDCHGAGKKEGPDKLRSISLYLGVPFGTVSVIFD